MKKNSLSIHPKISIITCVYNGERYISKLLDSVLNMGYPNVEHIIVNDGSNDSTEDIVMKYAELYKNKKNSNLYINYIKQENMGLGGATNTGLKYVTGEYWTWINCDDWYEHRAFFGPIKMLLERKDIDLVLLNYKTYVYSDEMCVFVSTRIDSNTSSLLSNINKQRKMFFDSFNNVPFLHFLMRTESFMAINNNMALYPFRGTQDVQFYASIIPLLKWKFCYKPVINFLKRDDSLYNAKYYTKKEYLDVIVEQTALLSINERKKKSLINIYYFYDLWNYELSCSLYYSNRNLFYDECKEAMRLLKSINISMRKYLSLKNVLITYASRNKIITFIVMHILLVFKKK